MASESTSPREAIATARGGSEAAHAKASGDPLVAETDGVAEAEFERAIRVVYAAAVLDGDDVLADKLRTKLPKLHARALRVVG